MDTPNLNTLLEGPSRMRYYTLVFEAVGGRQREFDWLVTDSNFTGGGPGRVSGNELTRRVEADEWLCSWGVFSGFRPGVSLDLDHLEAEPYADGNPGFWVAHPRIQHPLAEVEIVCWDATSTLLLCREPSRPLAESFRRYFPEAVDLDLYNQRMLARHRD